MRRVAVAAVVLIAAMLGGCGGGAAPSTVVRAAGTEYAYVMPDTITGGVVSMEFANVGKESHEFGLGRLKPGTTLADFRRQLTNGDNKGPAGSVDVGGVPLLSPGKHVTITRTLQSGTYVLVCFVPAPDRRTHFAHGMIRSFEVSGDTGDELPAADGVIVAHDSSYDVPELAGGTKTIELRNAASGDREFNLISLNPGKTLADAGRWFNQGQKGPAPLVFLGAMQSIPSGTSVFLTVDLEKGRSYVVFEGEHNVRATLAVK